MRLLGLALIIGGWLIAVSGLYISSATGVRGIFACVGIVVTVLGILGPLNSHYLKNAVWKR